MDGNIEHSIEIDECTDVYGRVLLSIDFHFMFHRAFRCAAVGGQRVFFFTVRASSH